MSNDRIDVFWSWVSEQEARLAQIGQNQSLMLELQERVSGDFPGIAIEIAAGQAPGYLKFVFTAFCNRELAPLVREIVRKAPSFERISAQAFVPPVGRPENLVLRGVTPRDFSLRFVVQNQDLLLEVYPHSWPVSDQQTDAIWSVLQLLLGEESIIESIGSIRLLPLSEAGDAVSLAVDAQAAMETALQEMRRKAH